MDSKLFVIICSCIKREQSNLLLHKSNWKVGFGWSFHRKYGGGPGQVRLEGAGAGHTKLTAEHSAAISMSATTAACFFWSLLSWRFCSSRSDLLKSGFYPLFFFENKVWWVPSPFAQNKWCFTCWQDWLCSKYFVSEMSCGFHVAFCRSPNGRSPFANMFRASFACKSFPCSFLRASPPKHWKSMFWM